MDIEHGAVDHERLRKFHLPHAYLESAFGNDWFGKRAENFARFFGTPTFLCGTTHLHTFRLICLAVNGFQRIFGSTLHLPSAAVQYSAWVLCQVPPSMNLVLGHR
jgi:hypothetical protein